jgi:predicted secreted protein
MATLGNNIIIGVMNGSTFTPFAAVKTHSVGSNADTIEKASATQQDWREFLSGRKDWNTSLNYLILEDANSNITDLLKVGNIYTIVSKDRSGTYQVQGNAICVSCRQDYQEGNLSVGSYSFRGTGALT